ncbi:MAG: hypothetical protein HKN71_08710, partial [Gemmatimonadetes bacterium]|nr:hypothetical protein [Gemmatimonadota bacterium]
MLGCVALVGCEGGTPAVVEEVPAPSASVPEPIGYDEWRALVDSLSEPGGFFETDNLVSNESSFLNVLGPMRRLAVYGGAYVGVGPDQNFSYIAQQRPELAFILDIRRDNLLQHLLFKALFHEASSRIEYLSLLLGVDPLPDPTAYINADADSIVAYIAGAPGGADSPAATRAMERVARRIGSFGLDLTDDDRETLRRFHDEFIRQGLDLRFTTLGQPPRPFYPTFGELLTARDLDGVAGSYLQRRSDFVYLKALQEANRVIPVVGDLAGPKALAEIGEEVRGRGLSIRAFYT